MSDLSLCSKLNLLARGLQSCPLPLDKNSRLSWYFGIGGKLCKVTVSGTRHDPDWLDVEVQYDSGRAEVWGAHDPIKRIISADEHCRAVRRAAEALNFKHETVPGGFSYPQVGPYSPIRIEKSREDAHA